MYNQALISRDQITFNVYNQETKYHITNNHLLVIFLVIFLIVCLPILTFVQMS